MDREKNSTSGPGRLVVSNREERTIEFCRR